MDDKSYMAGRRDANRDTWRNLLDLCLSKLGYDNPSAAKLGWIFERESAVAKLREVCGEFGDNDWPDALHLAEIIEKHLANHLHEEQDQRASEYNERDFNDD